MPLTIKEFWDMKHQTDDLIAQLGWDKGRAKAYIAKHYRKKSRLVMTDEQLIHLLKTLTRLTKSQTTTGKTKKRIGQKRRKRIQYE